MDMFTHLSRFALSWAMLGMALFFVGVIVWVFRPGSRKGYDNAANSIFRHERRPADGDLPKETAPPKTPVQKTTVQKTAARSPARKSAVPANKPTAVKGA